MNLGSWFGRCNFGWKIRSILLIVECIVYTNLTFLRSFVVPRCESLINLMILLTFLLFWKMNIAAFLVCFNFIYGSSIWRVLNRRRIFNYRSHPYFVTSGIHSLQSLVFFYKNCLLRFVQLIGNFVAIR